MAIAFVQDDSNFVVSAGATIAKAFTSDVTAGDMLIAAVGWHSDTQTCTITDSQGNSWTAIGSPASNANIAYRTQLFWARAGSTGACTVTATCSGSNADRYMVIAEYSGALAAGDPIDASNQTTGNGADPSVSVTTVTADTLLVGYCLGFQSVSAGAGFTARADADGQLLEDKAQAATGAVSVAYVMTSAQYCVSAAAFKEAAGGEPEWPPADTPAAPPLRITRSTLRLG